MTVDVKILQEILATVKLLSQQYMNIDSNMKILLSRINDLSTQLESKYAIGRPLTPNLPKQPRTINIPSDVEMATGMAELEELSKKKPSPPPSSAMRMRGDRENVAITKIPVTQTIVYPDGRKLFMANVEIYKDSQLLKQTRTSPKGKWIAPLNPGEYNIYVYKRDGGSKKLIELRYDITVPETSEPVELESAIVRG